MVSQGTAARRFDAKAFFRLSGVPPASCWNSPARQDHGKFFLFFCVCVMFCFGVGAKAASSSVSRVSDLHHSSFGCL